MLPLDESAATPPALGRTWFVSSMCNIYQRVRGNAEGEVADVGIEEATETTDGTESEGKQQNALHGKMAAEKTGGRRRGKAGKRR